MGIRERKMIVKQPPRTIHFNLKMLFCSSILMSGCCVASAQSTAQKQPLNGQLTRNSHVKIKPSAPPTPTGNAPRYHIDFTPANKSTKPFQNFQSSMPDKAVKTYLHKIKAEPNSLAGVMPTPAGGVAPSNQAPSTINATSTAADTGSQPRVLGPSGVAIPQSSGASSPFFK
jgi:hypothetical protein